MMGKAIAIPLLVAAACIIASCLGIVQDLITYQISEAWYHNWKFEQFNVPPRFHGPIGAALVGIGATWWLGLILSVPVLIVALFAPDVREMARIFVIAAVIVAAGVLLIEIGAYVYGLWSIDPSALPSWAMRHYPEDPIGATRVQAVNWSGYFVGAPIGLAAGLVCAVRAVVRARRL